ncbi:hypothetical protein [Pseudoalteromonas tunicata]|jgi:hypothetical protein|uniref:Uncharacterized protein n=1 Tax=Pseudoalteromonas tunicata D2 TaxID=87626 RepID=A4C680_9GAMM|nr:hypothetical protein [Pseudoalteromonas tunicata]ATC95457.1 hypothetical protein PTUN_a3069 [Pseudoalteromonas tunicata]AXT31034.1 hypothetical protein D1819_09660 [Pseudoalteromonas tunicata]EAR29484.1 hypothetical protein PTD2_11729 [Pseudoalteromonas tunicata D2]MDP4985689.1 hypothetical protein [Pseudoalteromonas tunicata]MDP5212388.1 hypothetical protein [Pseudoalteromonas tunicata]
MLILLVSLVFALLLSVLALKKGMPVKRWLIIGALVGPIAVYLFNVHYRRALLRALGQNRSVLTA